MFCLLAKIVDNLRLNIGRDWVNSLPGDSKQTDWTVEMPYSESTQR